MTTAIHGNLIAYHWTRIKIIRVILVAFVACISPWNICQGAIIFQQTNLVSSVSGLAPVTDANLKNPWGIAFAPSGPFWVSDQLTGVSTLYDSSGQPFPVGSPLVVTIPSSSGGPTGIVFNSTSDFQLLPGSSPAFFLFANLDGSISGWNPAVSPTSAVVTVLASAGESYTGLALGTTVSGNFLYAADSANAKIDVFDGAFAKTSLGGSFTDPGLPAGFTPYNIQNLAGTLYVTYENEVSGGGIVSAFDLNGGFLGRITSNAAGGPLDGPWGLALAPAGFGSLGGALLVGNEEDGHISAFDPATGVFLGQLRDSLNQPIANPGLWGLTFGNGGLGGDPNTLYFAAGIDDEKEGLFGSISPIGVASVPEPSSAVLFGGLLAIMAVIRRRQKRRCQGVRLCYLFFWLTKKTNNKV